MIVGAGAVGVAVGSIIESNLPGSVKVFAEGEDGDELAMRLRHGAGAAIRRFERVSDLRRIDEREAFVVVDSYNFV